MSPEPSPAPRRGMVLGKFLPPHAGHLCLIDFARALCDELTVVVGTLAREPISGELRAAWMHELCGAEAKVLHLRDDNPQDPAEDPDFWGIWERSLRRILPTPPDLVFASETYGQRLAEVLGARFVPFDVARAGVPLCATEVRADPMAHWQLLPPPVRAYYAKRVAIVGPESTGKTSLAQRLAERFETLWVPEYARTYLEARGRDADLADMVSIASGQAAAEDALARRCGGLLFCDTDPLSTAQWSEALHGEVPAAVSAAAKGRRYALTLLLRPDVPRVADRLRYLPEGGEDFFERSKELLVDAGRAFVEIGGDFDQRERSAVEAVEQLLRRAPAT